MVVKYDEDPRVTMAADGALHVHVDDPLLDGELELEPDLLVLGDRVVPHPKAADVARGARVHRDSTGFFQDDNSQHVSVQSNRRGIFFTGACRGDLDLEELARDVEATVAEVARLLKAGRVTAKDKIAVVDQELCKFCLTCYRTCPHQAIEMDHTAEAVVVVPVACEGCGVCVGECPAKAIKMSQETKG
jgi:heterodisulfide reductase subunit A